MKGFQKAAFVVMLLVLVVIACVQTPETAVSYNESRERDVPSFTLIQATKPLEAGIKVADVLPRTESDEHLPVENDPALAVVPTSVQEICGCSENEPPLRWGDPPEGTVSFVLIYDDPEIIPAEGEQWQRWLLYNIPANERSLPDNLLPDPNFLNSEQNEEGNFRWLTYSGPCILPNQVEQFVYTLYALDVYLEIEADFSKQELLNVMEGHILSTEVLARRCPLP
ncbi:MAG: YbhB/YbcL family Raf kinase inhibitor-like protein [Anaerolineales bacterium]|nr:YbhB/YbcL family Raf kinase inhibitor-like protein [Anaerolineales bacterium]